MQYAIQAYFRTYPQAVACLVCDDGEVFHLKDEAAARYHARQAGIAVHRVEYAPVPAVPTAEPTKTAKTKR